MKEGLTTKAQKVLDLLLDLQANELKVADLLPAQIHKREQLLTDGVRRLSELEIQAANQVKANNQLCKDLEGYRKDLETQIEVRKELIAEFEKAIATPVLSSV